MSTGVLPSLIGLLATTSGRDKTARVVQYLMRFLASKAKAKVANTPVKEELEGRIKKYESLGTSMAMTRKVLRFGRPIGIIIGVIKTIQDIMNYRVLNVPKALASVVSQIALCLFFLFDHYLYFERIGLANNPARKAKWDFLSNFFWFVECIAGIVKNIFERMQAQQTLSRSEFEKKNKELMVDTARNILDIPIAWGFMYEGSVSNDKMGLLGVITSLIGLYQLWK